MAAAGGRRDTFPKGGEEVPWRRAQYGKLNDELANDYFLSSDHYPDMLEKAVRILANYQNTRASAPYRASGNKTGVTFLQRGGRGGRGAGRGG